jgi:hypothetical protein
MRTARDGLLYHPDGEKADDVLKRMAEGTTNYRLDDPFKPALDETKSKLERLADQIFDAEARVRMLKAEQRRVKERLEAQQEAITQYAETGEIDPVLVPSVERLAKAEVAKQDKKIRDELDFEVPDELVADGWSQKGPARVTEHEIIITIKKSRTDKTEYVEKAKKRIAKKVEQALLPYQTDDSHFRGILRERIATRPQQPKGPPDD